jgi:hypothetical protein
MFVAMPLAGITLDADLDMGEVAFTVDRRYPDRLLELLGESEPRTQFLAAGAGRSPPCRADLVFVGEQRSVWSGCGQPSSGTSSNTSKQRAPGTRPSFG